MVLRPSSRTGSSISYRQCCSNLLVRVCIGLCVIQVFDGFSHYKTIQPFADVLNDAAQSILLPTNEELDKDHKNRGNGTTPDNQILSVVDGDQPPDVQSLIAATTDVGDRPDTEEVVQKAAQVVAVDTKTTATESKEDGPPKMVVITTRFMQHQPNLVHLGRARLRLFETFCLSTILNQSFDAGKIIWLIRVDPELDNGIKEALLAILKRAQKWKRGLQIFLIAKNNNSKARFGGNLLDYSSPGDLWMGAHSDLLNLYTQSFTHLLLQVGLDADDGLHKEFLQTVYSKGSAIATSLAAKTQIWCVTAFLEWHIEHQFPKQHFETSQKLGHIVPGRSVQDRGCITAGMTLVFGTHATREHLPDDMNHVTLQEKMGNCAESNINADGIPSCLSYVDVNGNDEDWSVYDASFGNYSNAKTDSLPAVLKARTGTSASMAGVYLGTNYTIEKSSVDVDKALWKQLNSWFALDQVQVKETKLHLEEHMTEIAADNLEGQCTKGHSCRSQAKDLLKQVVGVPAGASDVGSGPKDESDTQVDIKPNQSASKSPIIVVTTRFQQHQPHLIELGLSRLELFKTFCLPSMVAQSNQDFLWLIYTDPDLNETIKVPLLESLENRYNFVVVPDLRNGLTYRGQRKSWDEIWSGSKQYLDNHLQQAQIRTLLHSRLDVDDGLHRTFISTISKSAKRLVTDPNQAMIWCIYRSLEWRSAKCRSLDGAAKTKSMKRFGRIDSVEKAACITAGLVMVYGGNATRDTLPMEVKHHSLKKVLPSCDGQKKASETRAPAMDISDLQKVVPSYSLTCLGYLYANNETYGAIRPRMPSSASMGKVEIEQNTNISMEDREARNMFLYEAIKKHFGVARDRLGMVQDYFDERLPLIAADNLRGQCTPGHSCRNSSKELLGALSAPR